MSQKPTSDAAPLPDDRASSLTDLVAVAEGSIVSRVLARTGGGNVTLFAFDREQALSEHTAPFDALVQVLTGSMVVTIAGRDLVLESGQMVRMPADVPHAVRATEPSRMLLVMLRDAPKAA